MIRTEVDNCRRKIISRELFVVVFDVGFCMVRDRFQRKIDEMQKPDERSDVEQIWEIVRGWLVISRVLVLILTVVLAEFTEEYILGGISLSAWCIIVGIPLLIIISVFILLGDRTKKNIEVNRNETLLHPILERQ